MLRTFSLITALLVLTTPHLLAATPQVAIVADISGSMATSDKLRALQEGAKLAIALVDGQVVIIAFNDDANVSPSFALTDHDSRRRAMAYVDRLTADGGTNYLVALSKLTPLPPGTPTVFISDGANGHGSNAEVLALARKAPGPIHTIAIDASGKAKTLLTEMAAATSGSAVSVDDAEGLTKALLAIAQRLGGYHVHTPSERILRFSGCRDNIIAIGYDTEPQIVGSLPFPEPPYQHHAKLRTENVILSRVNLATPTDLEIRSLHPRSPTGRLALVVLRSDLVQPVLRVPTAGGKVPAGGDIQVATEFIDRQGKRIDPRTRPNIQVEYGLRDANGNIVVRKPAVPSDNEPVLTATLPVPDKAGPFTVVQIEKDSSSGVSFSAEQQKTMIAVEPIHLAAEPSEIKLSPSQGDFTVELSVKPTDGSDAISIDYNAELARTTEHLTLVRSQSSGELLKVELRADRNGTYRGDIVIHGNAATPIAPLKVPYEFQVRPKHLGVALPSSREVNVGTVVANSGEVTLANWSVPSLDVEEAPDATVRITDLTCGSSVIPFRAGQATITPAKEKPAPLKLLADVGNVPAGVYRGSVTLRLADSSDSRRWETNVRLTVTEPLRASSLDFGKVETGRTVKRQLLIRNAAAPLRNVPLRAGTFTQRANQLRTSDINFNMPDQIPVILGNSDTAIEIAITLSPFVQARGLYETSLSLARTPDQHIEVPVRVEIVGEGDGESGLLVAPAELRLKSHPGEVVKFALRVKLADTTTGLTDISVTPGAFEDAEKRRQALDVDYVFPTGAKLSAKTPVGIDGFLIAPDRTGSFTGSLFVRSTQAGTKRVPVILEVK